MHWTVKENKSQNMAIYAVFLIAVCLSATSAVHKPCGVGQCKLVLVGQNPAVAFQQLASEDGVRLVYLNLEIGNNSVHPLESDERFLPKRWIWAKTIREPMLLMTDDAHDIHSLGLLRRQKRYMTVQLAEQPAGCLANLNVSCQDNVIGKTLLSNVTNLSHGNRLPPTDCVCSFHTKKMYREGWEILCCSVKEITERNSTVYRCGIAPENDWFVKPFHIISFFLRYILLYYGLAIPLLLPDWVFNLEYEWSKAKEEQNVKINQVSPNRQHVETTQIDQIVEQEDETCRVSPNEHDGTVLLDIEETVEAEDDSPKELDRRYGSNLSVVDEIKDEQKIIDSQVSPNQQRIEMTNIEHIMDSTDNIEKELRGSEELDRKFEENVPFQQNTDERQIKANQVSPNQQHIEMTKVENTMKSKDNTAEDSNNPKELDRRYERNVFVVHEDEDEQEIKDNPVSPNQQEIVSIVETEQTRKSEDDTSEDWQTDSSEELDRICEDKLSAVHEAQKEIDFEIPIDDMSPITLCALLSDFVKTLPLIHMNFNLRLLLLFFVLFPIVVHIKLAVIFFYELEFYHEVYRKFNFSMSDILNLESEFSFQSIASENWRTIVWEQIGIGINAAVYCSLFVILTLVRPKDMLCRKTSGLSICGASFDSLSLGEDIVQNLTIQRPLVCELASSVLELYLTVLKKCLMKLALRRIRGTRLKRALRSWCVILSIFPGFLISIALGIVFLLVFLIIFVFLLLASSPLSTFSMFVLKKGLDTFYDLARSFSQHIGFMPIVLVLTSVSFFIIFFTIVFFSVSTIARSVQIIINTFLFTIMGVVLNVEFVTPYVAFILVVARNVHLCFLNLQNRYKEVKDMISKHWEEETTNLLWVKCSNNRTIPKKLFWFVCSNEELDYEEQILPLKTEICFMLRDMALIIFFLGLFFFAVLVFETIEEISALVSTFFVFISGVIPTLIFKRFTKKEQFSGWDKIKIDNKIKKAVQEYILKSMEENTTSLGSSGTTDSLASERTCCFQTKRLVRVLIIYGQLPSLRTPSGPRFYVRNSESP